MIRLATIATGEGPTGCLGVGDGFYPLASLAPVVGDGLPGTVAALVAEWHRWADRLRDAAREPGRLGAGIAAAEARLLTPLHYPGKVLCAGANYYDHIAEMGVTDTRKEAQRLFFFHKPPRQALVGPGPTVRKPRATRAFDWEVELVAVIGRTARHVHAADALSHIGFYAVGLDLSARDLNQAPETFYRLDWVAGKGHDTCGPVGPWLVPAEDLGDPMDLGLRLRVNGELKQDGRTSGMIFSIAEQIETLSRIMTLEPGDMVFTGTPAGVGAPKGTFLSVGDRVAAEIDGIGRLEVEITADE